MKSYGHDLFGLLLVCFLTLHTEAEENCDHLGTLLYEDLACTPEIPAGKKCPTNYKCASFDKSNTTCYFRGRNLKVGEKIEYDVSYAVCRVDCECYFYSQPNMYRFHDRAGFACGAMYCGGWMDPPLRAPDCYRTFELGKCCSTGQKCPPFDGVEKCVVDGKEYREGMAFSKGCMGCVCKKGWAGKFEAPFCKRKECGQQIDMFGEISEYCAPFYLDRENLCCPDDWLCYSEDDVVIPSNSSNASSDLRCKYGKLDLKIGDRLEFTYDHINRTSTRIVTLDVTCECILPPFLTCKQQL